MKKIVTALALAALLIGEAGSSFAQDKARSAPKQPTTQLATGIYNVTFSANGAYLAVAGDAGIRIFRRGVRNKWTIATSSSGHNLCVAFAPVGHMLAVGNSGGEVDLFNGKRTIRLRTKANLRVSSIAFSPDGRMLGVGGIQLNGGADPLDGVAELWDVSTGSLLRALIVHPYAVNCVAFSPGGKTLAIGGDGLGPVLELWDTSTGIRLQRLETATGIAAQHGSSFNTWIFSVAFSPDGSSVIACDTGSSSGPDVSALDRWDVTSGKLIKTIVGEFSSVTYSADGRTLAIAHISGSGGAVDLYSVLTGMRKTTLAENSAVNSMCFSAAGDILAVGTDRNTVDLWRASTGKHLLTLKINP